MSRLFVIFLFLAFYVLIFVTTLKNSILKVLIISLNLLISYSLLTQLWGQSHRISLSDDIELNSGLQRDINQCFSMGHCNLTSAASHNFNCLQLHTQRLHYLPL